MNECIYRLRYVWFSQIICISLLKLNSSLKLSFYALHLDSVLSEEPAELLFGNETLLVNVSYLHELEVSIFALEFVS